jgi:hypothetical protein
MEKTFTLNDLQCYYKEVRLEEMKCLCRSQKKQGPGKLAIQNILGYSTALNILRTRTVGTIYHLAN